MAARPARAATVTYGIGERALTPAAMRLIIKRTALAAADQGLVDLMGADLDHAIDALSTHSLRVGLTQDLFANGEDAGPIAQALRWTRSEEHTSELQSLMRISYAVFCLKKKNTRLENNTKRPIENFTRVRYTIQFSNNIRTTMINNYKAYNIF